MKWVGLGLIIVTIYVVIAIFRYEIAEYYTPNGFYHSIEPVPRHDCVPARGAGYYCEEQ